MKKLEFKKITYQDMKDYIINNAIQDKEWFKSVALDENGKYQHLAAVRAFCERYMPEIIPVAKPKVKTPTEDINEW